MAAISCPSALFSDRTPSSSARIAATRARSSPRLGQPLRQIAKRRFLLLAPLRETGQMGLLGPKPLQGAFKRSAFRPQRVQQAPLAVSVRRQLGDVLAKV